MVCCLESEQRYRQTLAYALKFSVTTKNACSTDIKTLEEMFLQAPRRL
jgi:hypothetical protein